MFGFGEGGTYVSALAMSICGVGVIYGVWVADVFWVEGCFLGGWYSLIYQPLNKEPLWQNGLVRLSPLIRAVSSLLISDK